jgi:hypothetical protein
MGGYMDSGPRSKKKLSPIVKYGGGFILVLTLVTAVGLKFFPGDDSSDRVFPKVGQDRDVAGSVYLLQKDEYAKFMAITDAVQLGRTLKELQAAGKSFKVDPGTRAKVLEVDEPPDDAASYKIQLLNGPRAGAEVWCGNFNLADAKQ